MAIIFQIFSLVRCGRLMRTILIFLGMLVVVPIAEAADPALNTGNTAWILTSTALVLFMTLPGLALFYGGLVQTRNVLSILMQCFAITGLVTVLWILGVYSLVFGEGNAWIGGLGKFLFAGVVEVACTVVAACWACSGCA